MIVRNIIDSKAIHQIITMKPTEVVRPPPKSWPSTGSAR